MCSSDLGVCTDLGLATQRVPGRSGVWVCDEQGQRKVAAIGVRVAQGVTMHGFAINCDNDRSWFDRIVPCGIRDAGVTSLSEELGRAVTVDQVALLAETHVRRVLAPLRVALAGGAPAAAI